MAHSIKECRHDVHVVHGLAFVPDQHEELEAHAAREIVDKEQEEMPSAWSRWRNRAAEITVNETKRNFSMVLSLGRERGTVMLCGDVGLAQLLEVVQLGDASHHFMARHPPQHIEVEVPVAIVPEPSFFRSIPGSEETPTWLLPDSGYIAECALVLP